MRFWQRRPPPETASPPSHILNRPGYVFGRITDPTRDSGQLFHWFDPETGRHVCYGPATYQVWRARKP